MSKNAAPRILICRMSSLGDTVQTMPIACALREAFPSSHLAWVVEKSCSSIIREHPALSTVIPLDTGWSKSPTGIRDAVRMIKAEGFDVLIDCEGTICSGLLGWLTAIPKRIGFTGSHASVFNRMLTTERIAPVFDHLTDRSLELLIPIGIHSPRVRWHLPIPAKARSWATRWRRNIPNPKIAMLDPGVALMSEHWDARNFARIACHLRDAYQYRCIICWSSNAEREFANRIVEHSRGSASLAPHTDLQHLAALLELSDLFISGDTEPLHVSVALGTPTINLHPAATPKNSRMYRQLTLQSGVVSAITEHPGKSEGRSTRSRKSVPAHAVSYARVCDAVAEIETKQRLLRAG